MKFFNVTVEFVKFKVHTMIYIIHKTLYIKLYYTSYQKNYILFSKFLLLLLLWLLLLLLLLFISKYITKNNNKIILYVVDLHIHIILIVLKKIKIY